MVMVLSMLAVPALADDWEQLRQDTQGIKTIQADFVQKKKLKILKVPLVSKGTFRFQAPGLVRWQYESPVKVVTLVVDGAVKRYTWTSDRGYVLDSSSNLEAMRIVMEKITGWLAGKFAEDDIFKATLKVQEGGPPTVILMPENEAIARFIERVELVFSSTPGVLASVRIIEGPAAETVLRFENVKLNETVDQGQFKDVGD
jgi:outer membrane lipoprotein carrier protein